MRTNKSLRFLVIAGAFLSAETALAQHSLSNVQTLVSNNTSKAQLSGVNNFTKPDAVSDRITQTEKYVGTDTDDGTISVDRRLVRPAQSQFSGKIAIANSPQTNVFVSDVASIDRQPQVSSVPNQAQPATPVEIPVQKLAEISIEIPVPLPRTQLIKKVVPTTYLPQAAKPSAIAITTSYLNRTVKPSATPITVATTYPSRAIKPNPSPSAIAIPTLPPVSATIPISKPTAFVNNANNQPSTPLAPVSKPTAVVNNVTNQASAESIYPLMTPAPITSKFGWRTHPLTGTRRFHAGIDIGAPTGTPVVATASGTVISAGWNGGYGKAIVIQHNDVKQTLYGHLSEVSVQPGQVITQGMVIGLVGSTGNSTGPHLHFESRMPKTDTENAWVAVDPIEEIQYAVDNLRRSMPFARKDLPQGL